MHLLQPSGDRGLGSWPARRARIRGDTPALRSAHRDLTWAELADSTARTASALRAAGVGAGDRVAWVGLNDVATFEVLFATTSLGAVFVPVNVRLHAREVAHALTDCGAAALVVGHGADHLAREVPPLLAGSPALFLLAPVEGVDAPLLAEAAAAAPPAEPVDVDPDSPAVLLYTSGTTGRPKGAVLTHANVTWNTVNQLAHLDVGRDERAVCTAPLFHAVGLGMVTLPALFKGGSVLVLPRFDAATLLRTVAADRVTSFSCVPTMLQMMADHADFAGTDLSSLRTVVYGGSPVVERVARAWLDRGVEVAQGYGMTECAPGVYMQPPADGADRPVSIGSPHFFTDVAALGEDLTARPLVPGVQAELLVRGPHVFAGYWGREAESRATLVEDRWYRTGDVVRVDADGTARVVDRVKDVIISGGENVYPAEVEAALTELPDVRSAAVVAVGDERWGEVGVAYVAGQDGTVLAEDRVLEHLRSRLARFKVPRWVFVVDDLPLSATGKIRRVDLRRRAQADVAERLAHQDDPTPGGPA